MIKILSLIVLISSSLFSQSFDEFLNNAIQNSPYLKSSNLGISQAKERGSILQRYENPSLELEYSQLTDANSNGYKVGFTQAIRLWKVGSDKENLSDAIARRASSLHSLNRAEFIRDISLLFTLYGEQKKSHLLRNEELSIAKHIYEISSQRNIAGTISKGLMLQAQVDYEMVEIKIESLNLDIQNSYFKLLKFAGYSQEIDIDFKHEFILKTSSTSEKNPELLLFDSQKREAIATSELNSNKVKWIGISAEYENESEEDIFRVGASIPLTLFNTSSQETKIAKLQADKAEFLIQGKNAKLHIEKIRLQKQKMLLLRLKSKNEKTLKTQIKLLKMFEDAYKIANVNLLELQNIKSRVIQTKENLIKISTALSQNTIITNYVTGAYNE